MPTVELSYPHTSERRESRMRIPGISASICRLGILPAFIMTPCSLFDINQGGIGIISDRHDIKVLDKVKLYLNYQNIEHAVQGIVAYKKANQNKTQYGIIFTIVPASLDRQIAMWYKGLDLMVHADAGKQVHTDQRRSEQRYIYPHLVVKITPSNPLDKIKQFTVDVINISGHGLRFSSPLFNQPLDSPVSLDVCYENVCVPADGVITAVIKTDTGYEYRVKVTNQHSSFTHFIEQHFTETIRQLKN